MKAKLTELLKTTFNEQYEKRHMITHQLCGSLHGAAEILE